MSRKIQQFVYLLIIPIIAISLKPTLASEHKTLADDTFRCCAIVSRPFVTRNESKPFGFGGIAIDYLENLERATSISCGTLIEYKSPDGTPGWSNFIRERESCAGKGTSPDNHACNCDVGVGAFFETEDRMGVDFVPYFAMDEISVLVDRQLTLQSSNVFFLTAFSGTVWLCIGCLVILFTVLKVMDRRFVVIERGQNIATAGSRFQKARQYLLKQGPLFRLRKGVQSTLDKLLGRTTVEISGDTNSFRQWCLNFTIVLCGLFLILSYEASMTASLVQDTATSPYRSFQDFRSCNIKPDDVCFTRGGTIENLWDKVLTSTPCHERYKSRDPTRYDSDENAIEGLLKGDCKFLLISSLSAIDALDREYCGKLTQSGDPFFTSGVHFILPKNSGNLQRFKEGTLAHRTKYSATSTMPSALCNQNTGVGLTFMQMGIFFFMAFGVCGLIFLEMVFDPQTALKSEEDIIRSSEGPRDDDVSKQDNAGGNSDVNSSSADSIADGGAV